MSSARIALVGQYMYLYRAKYVLQHRASHFAVSSEFWIAPFIYFLYFWKPARVLGLTCIITRIPTEFVITIIITDKSHHSILTKSYLAKSFGQQAIVFQLVPNVYSGLHHSLQWQKEKGCIPQDFKKIGLDTNYMIIKYLETEFQESYRIVIYTCIYMKQGRIQDFKLAGAWDCICQCEQSLSSWLIIYGFTSRSRIFHLYGDVTIVGEGLQNFTPMLGAQGL
jgi:hypothetical protein